MLYALKNSQRVYPNVSRSLFTRAKRNGASELVLTNNAGIFGARWSLEHHPRAEHSDVTIACFPFWLDKIDSQHEMRDWGQTLLGFPATVRAVFKQLYPNYPLDKVVTWQMMKAVRNHTIDELKTMPRVQVHDLRDIADPDNYAGLFDMSYGDLLKLNFKNSPIISVPQDTQVYNWVKIPRPHHLNFLPETPHTDLYTRSPAEVTGTPILVLGSGLSIPWLQRDFDTDIIAIVSDLRVELPKIPSTMHVDYSRIFKITPDDILDANNRVITVQVNGKQIAIPVKNFVSAIGYIPDLSLTKHIPDKQKTERFIIPGDNWIAPRNIPIGTLTQSLSKYFQETSNVESTFELQFHHHPGIVQVIRDKMKNDFGIELREEFFDLLRERIAALADPLDELGELSLFITAFENSGLTSQQERSRFERAMQTIQADKKQQIDSRKYTANPKPSTFTRSYSSSNLGAKTYTGSLPESSRKKMQNIAGIFFNPDNENIEKFDNKNHGITNEDRAKLQAVLDAAQQARKTFCAF